MALPLMLANILGGVGQGVGGAGQVLAAARDEERKLAAQKSTEQHQRRMEEIGAEKGTVSPQALTTFYETLGLPVPSGLASLGRIPEGVATQAMTQATKQAETQRALSQGRQVADDMTTQYGRVVPNPGDERPGPIQPTVDDPYLRMILNTVRTTGLTDKTAPQVEAYGKFRAERDVETQKYERGQKMLRDLGIIPGGGTPGAPLVTEPPQATPRTPAGATTAKPQLPPGTRMSTSVPVATLAKDGGTEVRFTEPTDPHDLAAIAEYGTTFRNLPEPNRQYVRSLLQREKVEVSSATGAGGVTAKAAAESGLPLYQSKKDGQHIIDLKNDAEVDYFGTKGADLEKNPKGYKLLSADAYKQWVSIKEMEGMFSEFERIAPGLVKQPGLNKLQQLEFWAKNAMGVPGLQTDLDALKGATLRVAKAMQGSAQGLSDADRKTVEGMLPTANDTADSALRRLQQAYRIMGHMKGAILGQSRASDKVRDAVGETAPPTSAPAPGAPGSPWKRQ